MSQPSGPPPESPTDGMVWGDYTYAGNDVWYDGFAFWEWDGAVWDRAGVIGVKETKNNGDLPNVINDKPDDGR